MENKWTFEWASQAMKFWIYNEKNHLVMSTSSKDEARRIVACVNFCAGVSTEMLEANTLLGEMEKGRILAGELGKKLGEP